MARGYYVLRVSRSYSKDVECLLAILEEDTDPECVALMMEFLLSLVKLKIAALTALYPACVKSAMIWVPIEQVRNRNGSKRRYSRKAMICFSQDCPLAILYRCARKHWR